MTDSQLYAMRAYEASKVAAKLEKDAPEFKTWLIQMLESAFLSGQTLELRRRVDAMIDSIGRRSHEYHYQRRHLSRR